MKRIAALLLCGMLMSQSVFVYGATFKDLKDAEWAETYINKMADRSIITGFLGEYKPNDPVNKYSAIVMIYRMLKASGKVDTSTIPGLVTKYNTVINQYSVPNWPDLKEATAYMIENGIISADDLKYFMNGEEHINARRYEISTYLGKSLNIYLKENTSSVITLPFKDSSSVSGVSAPYVNLLVKKGILNGDLDGNFKPYEPINRSAMAKVLSLSLDVLSNSATPVVTPTPSVTTQTPVLTTTREGTVSYLISDSKKIIVIDKTDTSKSDIYAITSDVKVYSSGVLKDYGYISKDQSVLLTFEGTKLVRVDLGSWTASSSSSLTVQSIADKSGSYRIEVTDSSNKSTVYYTSNGLKNATLDGASVPISKLMSGDKIQIRLNDMNQIIDIVATTKKRYYEGILTSQIKFDGKPQISMKSDANESLTFELGSDVTIKRNDKIAVATDLQIGDYVKVRTDLDKVSTIESYSMTKTTFSGIVEQMVYGRSNTITIKSDDGVSKTYEVSPTATITLDGRTTDISELKVNYRVDVDIEGTGLVKITAKKTSIKDQVAGVITKAYKDLNLITLRTTNGSGTQYVTVTYNSSTRFISSTGGSLSYTSLEVDKSVFVYGSYKDNFFLAEKVILLD